MNRTVFQRGCLVAVGHFVLTAVAAFPLSSLGLFVTWPHDPLVSQIARLHPAFYPVLLLSRQSGGDSCIKLFLPVSDVLRLREESGAAHLRERRPGTPSSAGDPPAAAGLAGDELLCTRVLLSSLASQLGHTQAY